MSLLGAIESSLGTAVESEAEGNSKFAVAAAAALTGFGYGQGYGDRIRIAKFCVKDYEGAWPACPASSFPAPRIM
jgi:hypothetical protein